jgi:hypothetical protein
MTPIPKRTNAIPVTPTQDDNGQPEVCYACGVRRAIGIGVGFQHKGDKDPRWLCAECAPLAAAVRQIKRFDVYELKALDGAVDEVGEFLTERGITDLALLDELDARMLCKRAVIGFGDRLRQLLREEVPF